MNYYSGVHMGPGVSQEVASWEDFHYIEIISYRDKLVRWHSVPTIFVDQFVIEFTDQIIWIQNNLRKPVIQLFQSHDYTGLGHTSKTYDVYRFLLYVEDPADLMLYKLRWYKPT